MRVAARMVFMTALVGIALASGGCSKDTDICSNCNNTTNNYVTQTVGPNGKTIPGPDGLQVTIPAGALTADTDLTIGTPADGSYTAPGTTFTPAGKVYAVLPHGQMFAGNIMIYLPDPTNGAGTVWRADNETAAWTQVGAVVPDSVNGQVYARVDATHFSLYAVATGGGGPPGCNLAQITPECFANAAFEVGTPTCNVNFQSADTFCGGCMLNVSCNPEGCYCTYGDGQALQNQPGVSAATCASTSAMSAWATQYCKQ